MHQPTLRAVIEVLNEQHEAISRRGAIKGLAPDASVTREDKEEARKALNEVIVSIEALEKRELRRMLLRHRSEAGCLIDPEWEAEVLNLSRDLA